MPYVYLGFAGVSLTIFAVAWILLALLVVALLAAAASSFFRSVGDFDNELREVTMDLSPRARRRFYELYATLRPKNPAVAWFLAVGLGPIGANLYREKWATMFGAIVSLNGLGAWWIESWFTTPYLVLIENRASIKYALELLELEMHREHPALGVVTALEPTTIPSPAARVSVAAR